jgi:hypothetical protein
MIPKPAAPFSPLRYSAALQHDHFDRHPTKDEGCRHSKKLCRRIVSRETFQNSAFPE